MNPVHVIGLGLGKEDLTTRHLQIIEAADVLVGGQRQLELFPAHKGDRLVIKGKMEDLIQQIQTLMDHKKVVVLASGDPLFHGIGSVLASHLDKSRIRILPNLTSVSAAFAAIRESWQDAKIISLHGKKQNPFPFSSLTREHKAIFLTDPEHGPSYIADRLIQLNIDGFRFCVLEKLGQETGEKITWFDSCAEIKEKDFAHPNLVILLKTKAKQPMKLGINRDIVSHETYLGMDDDQFLHSKGLITKSEIRCISLSKLRFIKKEHILWDIGSGSGSVSIEASQMIPWGQVYAFEKNPDRIAHIVHNIEKFNCPNIKLLNQDFPEGAKDLPRPDRIFVGGGGSHLEKIITLSCQYLLPGGVIVLNTVVVQNMDTAFRMLKEKGFQPEMVQIQVSRSRTMPFGDRLEALNPVWIIRGNKPMNSNKE